MATRLNQAMRNEIVDSVIAATTFPAQRLALDEEIAKHASDVAHSLAPAGLVDLSKSVPREWLYWADNLWVGEPWNPKRILSNAFDNGYQYDAQRIDIVPSAPMAGHHGISFTEEQFTELTAKATELAETYTRTIGGLRAVLNSTTTVEGLLKKMPELEPHIPKKVKSYPLAMTGNVLADLMKAGFAVA